MQDQQKPQDEQAQKPKSGDDGAVGDAALTEQSEKEHSEGGKIDRSQTPGRDYDV